MCFTSYNHINTFLISILFLLKYFVYFGHFYYTY